MQTEIQAIQSARQQYRAAFRHMAMPGANYCIVSGLVGVVLLSVEYVEEQEILVECVQAKSEETMINALTLALRSKRQ